MQRWYLLAVKTNQSAKAQALLNQQDIETYSPQITITDGKTTKVEPAFSTYIFAHFDPNLDSVLKINNTRGVRHVVKFGGQLAIVADDIIDAMRSQFDDVVVDAAPKAGDKVVITSGPFEGIEGIYKQTDKQQRDILLIQLVHNTHKIAVYRDQWVSV